MAIPVLDFSKLEGETRAETLAEIATACEQWGFFQLVNHGIPVELLERVKKVASEWYREEREDKFKDSIPVQLLNKLVDCVEEGGEQGDDACEELRNLDWEDVITLNDDTKWPSFPDNFKETMQEYRCELKKLTEKVMEVMDENLGLEKDYIKKAFSCSNMYEPFFGTKISHYPPCPRPDLAIGLRAHTDAGGVILLFQDDKVPHIVGGLQILKDDQWIDVQPLENTIVINTGDQIEAISNGRYKSVWHRVLATSNGTRRSIASFYNPSLKATIGPANQLVATKALAAEEEINGGSGYPKFLFGEYMDVYGKQKFMAKEPRFEAVGAMDLMVNGGNNGSY